MYGCLLIRCSPDYLAKKDENEPEEYLKFWNEFGQVLKEGLCEGNVNANELLNICKFYTSKSPNVPISLNTYIDRMKEGQKDIYYITGDSVNNLDNSPQVEGFKDKDIEVVYLTDNVDSFWTTATTNYKEKRFKSISKEDIPSLPRDVISPIELIFLVSSSNFPNDKPDAARAFILL